jgi:SpoVK/Ycf46/Vps4 family AAA+-type ATPase
MVTDKHERALITNVITPQDIGVTYDMIGGLDEVKETLRQCITYPLKYPRLYQEGVASEAAKGVLLFGPPGTGKTMLAKAVATEGGATFLTVDASTIENKWLGESEKNARAVFTLARRLAPCVIYLDEVDSVLSSRENGDDSSHGTLTSVKTTLMQEWDGLRTTKDRVVVIASTNRPFDLDEAVLRRLPRRIMVDLPDSQTRSEILAVTLAGNRLAPDVNLTQIASSLEGYTGSDIKEVCREAVLRVSHERAVLLEQGDNSTIAKNIEPSVDSDKTKDETKEIENEEVDDNDDDDDDDDDSKKGLHFNLFSPLRPVNSDDFKAAMQKLKASVHDSGRELQKVIEWNDKYAEGKRKKKTKHTNISMYI